MSQETLANFHFAKFLERCHPQDYDQIAALLFPIYTRALEHLPSAEYEIISSYMEAMVRWKKGLPISNNGELSDHVLGEVLDASILHALAKVMISTNDGLAAPEAAKEVEAAISPQKKKRKRSKSGTKLDRKPKPAIEEGPSSDELQKIAEELRNNHNQNKEDFTAYDEGNLVGMYFKDVGRKPLLTSGEVIELAKKMETGKQAIARLGQIERGEILTTSAEAKDLEQLIQEGSDARQKLIVRNTRLVVSIAKKYQGLGLPFSDLIQEGNIGLMTGIDNFNYKLGYGLSTYVTWWIRQKVTRALTDQGRTIRVPIHAEERLRKIRSTSHVLTQELARFPTRSEIAARLEIPEEKVTYILNAARKPASFQDPVGEDDNDNLEDFIEDREHPTVVDQATRKILEGEIKNLLSTSLIGPRQKMILEMRFGLGSFEGECASLDEIGKTIGRTRERVRQVLIQTLRILKRSKHAVHLKEYLSE